MNISLHPISDNDLPFLYEVYASTRQEEMAKTNLPTEEINNFLLMQFNLQHQHYMKYYPNSSYNLIQFKNKNIERLYIDKGEKDILVIDITLLPNYKGKKIGYRIMSKILAEAIEQNKPVFLHVEKFNPALQFYLQLGFQIQEDKDVYYYLKWSP